MSKNLLHFFNIFSVHVTWLECSKENSIAKLQLLLFTPRNYNARCDTISYSPYATSNPGGNETQVKEEESYGIPTAHSLTRYGSVNEIISSIYRLTQRSGLFSNQVAELILTKMSAKPLFI